jgi:hypothetical protein
MMHREITMGPRVASQARLQTTGEKDRFVSPAPATGRVVTTASADFRAIGAVAR